MSKTAQDITGLYERAVAVEKTGDKAAALALYEEVLAGFPMAFCDKLAAKTLARAQPLAEALQAWDRLDALARRQMAGFPEDPEGERLLSLALEAQGRGHQLTGLLRKAREQAHDHRRSAVLGRARQTWAAGDRAEALELYLAYLDGFEPDARDPRLLKGLEPAMFAAAELGRWDQLEVLARRTIDNFPDSPLGPERLQQALAAKGKEGDDIRFQLDRAHQSAETRRLGELYDQAGLMRKRGRPGEALAGYLAFLEAYPPESADERAIKATTAAKQCAQEAQAWPELKILAERLIARSRLNPEGHELLARALSGLGHAEAAAAAEQTAAELRASGRKPEVTIVTVVLEQHYDYIHQQAALIEALNPGVPFRMIVVDNTGPGEPGLSVDHPSCEVIPGVEPDLTRPDHGRGSYHHAAALNLAIQRVRTPYLLVLDPDYFVIYRNWIGEVLDHMHRRSLGLFGAPWHYAWNRKWRYFPCVHFLMVDLGRIPLREIDFTPALTEDVDASDSAFHRWMKQHAPILRNRMLLESRRDTGWLLRDRFKDERPPIADVTLPVIDVKAEFRAPRRLETPFGRWLERRLPSRWSFLPVEGSYVDAEDAAAFRFAPIRALQPERFVWRGGPFAVHLRGHMREDMRTDANPAHKERTATRQLLEAVHGSSSWTEWAFASAGQE